MLSRLWTDESGFIVSAELVLIVTIMVIGILVGMVEVQWAVIGELNDVSDAIGSLNQSFSFTGFTFFKVFSEGGFKSQVFGSVFIDVVEECDNNQCTFGCDAPVPEFPKVAGS